LLNLSIDVKKLNKCIADVVHPDGREDEMSSESERLVKFNHIFKEIEENRNIFENMVTKANLEISVGAKIEKAEKAVKFALKNMTGYFSSEHIESIFLDIANKYSISPSKDSIKENTFLHVATQVLSTGGHSRVIERWIKNSPSGFHSVVLLDQSGLQVPDLLKENVIQKEGEIIDLSPIVDPIKKGIELRKLGLNYKYIILHVNMEDFVPIIAFGNKEFSRPVLLVNHADHQFWLGGSVSDTVVNLRTWGKNLNVQRRGIENNCLLEIPIETKADFSLDPDLRKKHNVPEGDSLILTIGSDYKYNPVLDYDFIKTVREILNTVTNASVLAIGPSSENHLWRSAKAETSGKIQAIGTVPYDEIYSYINSCDLYLDSFPFFGGTTLIDVVRAGVPAVSLKTPAGQSDYVSNSILACKTTSEFIQKSIRILNDSEYSKFHRDSALSSLLEMYSVDSWREKLSNILSSLPDSHKIREIKPNPEITEIDLLLNELIKNLKGPKSPFKKLRHQIKRGLLVIDSKSRGYRKYYI
jgi:glycosyltransferase involved in cell wall biosynthesis